MSRAKCKQCHGKGTFVLYRGRGREVLPCTCIAAQIPNVPPAPRALVNVHDLLAAHAAANGETE